MIAAELRQLKKGRSILNGDHHFTLQEYRQSCIKRFLCDALCNETEVT